MTILPESNHSKPQLKIPPNRYGVSFSIKQCRNFSIDSQTTLAWLIDEMGFRRFRIMSYWDEYEKTKGKFDFSSLDSQVQQIAQAGGKITMCLGAKQPRWPEYHWPDWVWQASKSERNEALLNYVKTVVNRYKDQPAIVSWQLENEALLSNFGEKIEIDRARLRREFQLVHSLDSTRPVVMSTSTNWGIPLRQPIPDIVGFSLYTVTYGKNGYSSTHFRPWIFKLRAGLIRLIWRKPSFIHELQTEPWGPKAIWEMSSDEQDKSMSSQQIIRNIDFARQTNLTPIDLWGGEWWYWRSLQGDNNLWQTVQKTLTSQKKGGRKQ